MASALAQGSISAHTLSAYPTLGLPTIGEELAKARLLLQNAGDEHPALSAAWLVGAVTGKDRAALALAGDEPLGLADRSLLMAYYARRMAGEPLQYITGSTQFRTIEVATEAGALIPRPETEYLVELALEIVGAPDLGVGSCSNHAAIDHPDRSDHPDHPDQVKAVPAPSARLEFSPRALRVLEIGTGTGCVACAIASEVPRAEVWATDLSSKAVALAQKNVASLSLSDRVHVLEGDLADPVENELFGSFDLLISNPPYVPTALLSELPREVAAFEPTMALDGGQDGLCVVRRIMRLAPLALAPGGVLALELFEGHVDEAIELLKAQKCWFEIQKACDLAGKPRYLFARRMAESSSPSDSGVDFAQKTSSLKVREFLDSPGVSEDSVAHRLACDEKKS